MTVDLKTFANVRALHDSTTNLGEKASAAARMKMPACKAGMTVDQATSKLDTSQPTPPRSIFDELFNQPEFKVEMAERERARIIKADAVIARYGSADAVSAGTPMEAALRAACEPLLGPGETWSTIYRFDGWGSLDSRADMPATVQEAVTCAWPMPETVAAAWAEFRCTDRLTGARYTLDRYCDPPAFSEARRHLVEVILNTAPARSLNNMRTRGAWLNFWANGDMRQSDAEHQAVVATLRADIERMGQRIRGQKAGATDGSDVSHTDTVQSGQQGEAQSAHPSTSSGWTSAEFPAQGVTNRYPPL
ncbi:hypothetical protein MKL09_16775 [Methylobacterium sp. J-048]|uniref:hypothetical protein n=1 Tax=Methylobacterium sp. J-048 TaxID=2836635 RepID=UPI001FBAAE51|nr:hypothetical protein [Methylobacterium sp. J-048]MCJ2058200.1 hypothetical protein [Methylobacterium sp. J-048]